MNIKGLEQQIRDAGVAFITLTPINSDRFDFELLVDCREIDATQAAAKLASAFESQGLDVNPARFVIGWDT